MFAKDKVSQAMLDAVNSVLDEGAQKLLLEPKSEKVPTPTGTKVYGHSYGNSAKARKDQTAHDIDKLKGPKDKEMKEELKGNQDKIDANHNDKIDSQDFKILRAKKKVKEDREFTEKLLTSIHEKKDVVMPEDSATPAKNTDVADKSYLKDMGKKPTIKSDLKNLGNFLTGKKETNEEKSNKKPDWLLAAELKAEKKEGKLKNEEADITTDEISGRKDGGKDNDFKKYKVKLKGDVAKEPAAKEPEDTTSRKSIKAKKPLLNLKNLKVEEEVEMDEATIAGSPGWQKVKKDVTDKSGAIHTPMSRARNLARLALQKVNSDLGKTSK
jgi:hypothetical protein